MKKDLIIAVLVVAINAAGIFMVHAKVELCMLVMTFFVSSVLMWLSAVLTTDDIKEGRNVDWGLSIMIPMILPTCLWLLTVTVYLS